MPSLIIDFDSCITALETGWNWYFIERENKLKNSISRNHISDFKAECVSSLLTYLLVRRWNILTSYFARLYKNSCWIYSTIIKNISIWGFDYYPKSHHYSWYWRILNISDLILICGIEVNWGSYCELYHFFALIIYAVTETAGWVISFQVSSAYWCSCATQCNWSGNVCLNHCPCTKWQVICDQGKAIYS